MAELNIYQFMFDQLSDVLPPGWIITYEPRESEQVDLPCVIVRRISEVPFDTKTGKGQNILVDLAFFVNNTGSRSTLETVTFDAKTALHRLRGAGVAKESIVQVVDVTGERDVIGKILTANIIYYNED